MIRVLSTALFSARVRMAQAAAFQPLQQMAPVDEDPDTDAPPSSASTARAQSQPGGRSTGKPRESASG